MPSSFTDSEMSYADSDDLEIDFSSEYEMEAERDVDFSCTSPPTSDEEGAVSSAIADDPLADAEWTAQYEKEMKANEELEQELQKRLDGSVGVSEWCKCGKCNIVSLQSISECYCCSELEGCLESIQSDLVLQDFAPNTTLKCITEHPGFNPVCLQKWSLRMTADKFKTKGKQRYTQKGSEESFLRSVSYREFTRLVYGVLGNKRIPLPACAYCAIRHQFPVNKEESFTGFDLDEED